MTGVEMGSRVFAFADPDIRPQRWHEAKGVVGGEGKAPLWPRRYVGKRRRVDMRDDSEWWPAGGVEAWMWMWMWRRSTYLT